MKKMNLFLLGFLLVSVSAFCVIVQQDDFTPAQNGTLPSDLLATADGGADVAVLPLASMNPAPVGDHPGGDGYALRDGNLGVADFNWAFPNPVSTQTDCKMTIWVYLDWTTGNTPTMAERDYCFILRSQYQDPHLNVLPAMRRQGYMLVICINSYWGTIYPINFRPLMMKRVGNSSSSYTKIGTDATNDVLTGWHKITFQVLGTELKAFVDDVLVCSGTDSTYASGSPGFGYYDGNGSTLTYPYAATYDNFIFESIASSTDNWNLY